MMMLHTNMFSKERGNLTYYLDTWTHHVDLLQGMTETEKPFIRNGPWMVSAPRLCLGSFWGAAGQHGPKLSQHICSASVLDSCKFRESGHIPFWFTGSDSTVREHKEYYYFLDHLTEMSAIPLCTSVAMWPMWDLQEDVDFQKDVCMQAVQPGGVPAVDQEQRQQWQRVPPAVCLSGCVEEQWVCSEGWQEVSTREEPAGMNITY